MDESHVSRTMRSEECTLIFASAVASDLNLSGTQRFCVGSYVLLNASSSYRPKYFVSPNFERSFGIVYATRWSLVTLLTIYLVHFCRVCEFEFYINIYINIYYILTDSRMRTGERFMLFN